MKEFSKVVQDKLKYYVYALYKPDEDIPFYVGKGQGNRVFAHIKEAQNVINSDKLSEKELSEKLNIIVSLLKHNKEPRIEILRHGLENDKEALIAESVVIDLYSSSLSNTKLGYKSHSLGKKDLNRILHDYEEETVSIEEPAILIRINEYFNPETEVMKLYDRTRSAWRLNRERAYKAKYAFAVYNSKILEVYKISTWIEDASTMRADGVNSQAPENEEQKTRIEFVGQLAEQSMRDKYCGKYVNYTAGSQNPCQYNNV